MQMEEPEILLRLDGGLGNLMFQIAGIKSFSQFANKSVGFTNFSHLSQQYYDLGRILFPNYRKTIFANIKENMDFQTSVFRNSFVEPIDGYNDLGFLLNQKYSMLDNCYLQNHNMFTSKAYVCDLFDFSNIQLSKTHQYMLENNICASMHVRRGDYVDIQNVLPCQSVSYYKTAIDAIGDYDFLFIFSDDPIWCEENLFFKNKIVIDLDELVSMKMMAMCKKHIISNSTFSWWPAYLSNSNDVILPRTWFGPGVTTPRPIDHYHVPGWVTI